MSRAIVAPLKIPKLKPILAGSLKKAHIKPAMRPKPAFVQYITVNGFFLSSVLGFILAIVWISRFKVASWAAGLCEFPSLVIFWLQVCVSFIKSNLVSAVWILDSYALNIP